MDLTPCLRVSLIIFIILFLRKNWSTSWIVLTSRKMEFYKESKQPALANLVGNQPFNTLRLFATVTAVLKLCCLYKASSD